MSGAFTRIAKNLHGGISPTKCRYLVGLSFFLGGRNSRQMFKTVLRLAPNFSRVAATTRLRFRACATLAAVSCLCFAICSCIKAAISTRRRSLTTTGVPLGRRKIIFCLITAPPLGRGSIKRANIRVKYPSGASVRRIRANAARAFNSRSLFGLRYCLPFGPGMPSSKSRASSSSLSIARHARFSGVTLLRRPSTRART